MEIKLYKCLDEKNKITKTLADELVITGALRGSSSVISPNIMVETRPTDYNYAYIEEFGRYYFIKNITAVRKNAFLIEMNVDVLMSFSDEILLLSAVIDSGSEPPSDGFLENNWSLDARTITHRYNFNDVFDKENYIMVLIKGGTGHG